MKKAPHISDAEWQVMKVIWKNPPCLAQEIVAALSETTTWSEATIKTLLNRLVRKGALLFEKAGKAYLYLPAFTEEDHQNIEADSFLNRVFDGALSPLITHFVQSRKLTARELDLLEKMVKEKRKTK